MGQNEFLDEKIIEMMGKLENGAGDSEESYKKESQEKRSIYSGVKILGKWIYFEQFLLADGVIRIMLPKDFEPMSQEIARKKYPSEHRPEIIMTNETGTINLMFQYMEGEVTDATVQIFRNQVFGMMKRVNPGIKEQEVGTINLSGKTVAYVEFSNPVMNGKLYNLMFYLAVNGQPLMGSFNCQTKEMKYWRTVAFEMVQSIEIVGEGE